MKIMTYLPDSASVTFESYSKDDWVEFLKRGAYRGHHVNIVAKRLKKATSSYYDQSANQLEVITEFGKRLILDMGDILQDRSFSFSRFFHEFRMWFSDSAYAMKFNERITYLADTIIKKKANAFGLELDKFVDDQKHRYSFLGIESFFLNNIKNISESKGNKEVRDNLLKLSRKIRKKTPSIEGEVIASIIDGRVNALMS